jgi:hypothetical protein
MIADEAKSAFNARAEASKRKYLQPGGWPGKIRSIERMSQAGQPGWPNRPRRNEKSARPASL